MLNFSKVLNNPMFNEVYGDGIRDDTADVERIIKMSASGGYVALKSIHRITRPIDLSEYGGILVDGDLKNGTTFIVDNDFANNHDYYDYSGATSSSKIFILSKFRGYKFNNIKITKFRYLPLIVKLKILVKIGLISVGNLARKIYNDPKK